MAYSKPGLTTQFLGNQTPYIIGPAARTIALHATFPKGPDVPMLTSPSTLASWFGSPQSAASIGHYGPYAAFYGSVQAQPQTTGPVQYLICRQNVTRGMLEAYDSASALCFTLSAIGLYAGSNSVNLQCVMTLGGGGNVTSITFTDRLTNLAVAPVLSDLSVGGAQNLSTNASIATAINAAQPVTSISSVVNATAGSSTSNPATFHIGSNPAVTVPTAFAAGSDGLGSSFTDTVGGGGLLDQSLAYPADYVTATWDAGTIGPTIFAHTAAAAAVNSFRKAYLGPALGTTYSSMSGSYITALANQSRLTVLGHDGLNVNNHPVTQGNWTWDGFVGAAALAGLKASGAPNQSCINMPLGGFSSIAIQAENNGALSETQLDTLAGLGFTMLEQLPASPITIREILTTVPQQSTLTGVRNIYSNVTAQEEDDAVGQALYTYLRPLIGPPGATSAETDMLIATTAQRALSSLGNTIAGELAVAPSVDPNTGNIVCPVTYLRSDPVRGITVTIANTAA